MGAARPRSSWRIRLTGVTFGLIFALVLLSAWNTGTNLLYIVVGGIGSFLLISALFTGATIGRLRLRRTAPRSVYRSQPFHVHLRIENPKRVLSALGLRIENAERRNELSGYVLKIPPRSAAHVSVEEVFARRGVYPLPPTRLASTLPFGLFQRSLTYQDDLEVVVYPRIHKVRTTAVEQTPGARYSPRSPNGEGDEFYALREYVIGDDIRRIAWRASARLGTWVIRELSQDNSKFVVFALDTCRTDDPEFDTHFEEAVELTASLAVSLLERQYNVALEAPGVTVESGEGPSQRTHILEALARITPAPPNEYNDFEQMARRLEAQHVTLLCISPDARRWGRRGGGTHRVLDPRELIHG